MKKLVAIIHPDEWNQLLPFNSYIKTLKDENNYDGVISVVSYKGHIVVSEADEIVTTHDGNLFSYPSVLEHPSEIRRSDKFLELGVNFCIQKYGEENIDIKSWQNTVYDDGVVNEYNKPIGEYYRTSFYYAKKFFEKELTIKPTKKVFNKIKKKYGHFFTEKTFIILTRNFTHKAVIHNTSNTLPFLEKTIRYLTENGLKVINIGFPPQSYNIEDNYLEINENLTQEELICLFYLSYGVIMAADAGGFVTHYGSNVDFYILTEEWSVTVDEISISLVKTKKTNQTIYLIGKTDKEIYELLLRYGRPQNKVFSTQKL